MELCGLREAADKTIGTLSKGYRQRVGLADAMLGDPDFLILDEPTIGLDPNQVREVRHLVRSLSERHTVLISTHILAEAEAICQRVLIIDKGRIVADDTPQALSDRTMSGQVVVEMQGERDQIRNALGRLDGVRRVNLHESNGWHRFSLATAAGADVREAVFRTAVERGWRMRELTRMRASLEDVFHRLTLGDEDADGGTEAP